MLYQITEDVCCTKVSAEWAYLFDMDWLLFTTLLLVNHLTDTIIMDTMILRWMFWPRWRCARTKDLRVRDFNDLNKLVILTDEDPVNS